jgi:hypothetical protein
MNKSYLESINQLSAEVAQWLQSEFPQVCPLVRWFQGFGIPSEIYGETPYEWVFRCMAGRDWPIWRVRAARAIAKILEEGAAEGRFSRETEPEVQLHEELLENIFNFAAALSASDVLWEPLLAVLNRHWGNPGALMRSMGVRVAFQGALVRNQGGAELRQTWIDLISGMQVSALAADGVAALDGLLFMPRTRSSSEPDFEAIAEGFRGLALSYQGQPDYRSLFSAVIDRAQLIVPALSDEWLFSLAAGNNWPDWAMECLPMATYVYFEGLQPFCAAWPRLADVLIKSGLAYESQSHRIPWLSGVKCLELGQERFHQVELVIEKLERTRKGARRCSHNEFLLGRWAHTISELRDALRQNSSASGLGTVEEYLVNESNRLRQGGLRCKPQLA